METRLPLPPEALSRRSEEVFDNPRELIPLSDQYEDLQNHPAWLDFMGRLYGMQRDLGDKILEGQRDTWGNDITDQYRGMFTLLGEMMAIPIKVAGQADYFKMAEYNLGPKGIDEARAPTDAT